MVDATFEKLNQSDTPMYGPRKILLCGFPGAGQDKLKAVVELAGLSGISLVWVADVQKSLPLSELMALPDGMGWGVASDLPRAVIVAGITQNELHALMGKCRRSGMQQSLWAVLTPTSETWTLDALLKELQSEREAFQRQKGQ
jgi:hypothetical protein